MSGITRVGHAVWNGSIGDGSGRLSGESGAFHDLPYTFASRTADKAEHTDPEELLAAAHAGCFAMSLTNVLTAAGRPPVDCQVSAEVTLAPTPAGRRITRSEVTVAVLPSGDDPADHAWVTEQVHTADQRCPFSALVRDSGGDVAVTVLPRS